MPPTLSQVFYPNPVPGQLPANNEKPRPVYRQVAGATDRRPPEHGKQPGNPVHPVFPGFGL